MIDLATLFAWFVIVLLFCVFVAIIVALGSLPKIIAQKRNHPQIEAINALSWIGLALFGIGWPIAFVWAFLKSGSLGAGAAAFQDGETTRAEPQLESELKELRDQIADLKQELEALRSQLKKKS